MLCDHGALLMVVAVAGWLRGCDLLFNHGLCSFQQGASSAAAPLRPLTVIILCTVVWTLFVVADLSEPSLREASFS